MRWAGQHKSHYAGGKKSILLEAIADYRRYIWYANFGDAGSLNDINVLDKSSIVGAMLGGRLDTKTEPYLINEVLRDWLYFLVDGIYPEWAIFVKTYSNSPEQRKRNFAKKQEEVRKDVECAFGILVKRFHILKRPLRGWYLEDINKLLKTCVILHNMIVEERFGGAGEVEAEEYVLPDKADRTFPLFGRNELTAEEAAMEGIDLFAARAGQFNQRMQSMHEHFKLKADLVEDINSKFKFK